MNPDKLFDYLNGKLSDSEREEIERQLATDPHLQRELAIAREIHSRMHDSREVLIPDNIIVNRGAVLGRRVAIAFAVLVFINVLFGLYAIAFLEKKRRGRPPEEQNRQQLAEAVEKAAASALPTPTLDIGEVILRADAGQRDAVVKELIEGAEKYGGSGTRGLPDDNGLLVIVQLPSRRAEAFLERLEQAGATVPQSRHESATNGTTVIQVRVIEDASP
jgi:anti-sigma factor RsiW